MKYKRIKEDVTVIDGRQCPKCNNTWQSKILDTRYNEAGQTLTRRRECLLCGYRWSTVEVRKTWLESVLKNGGLKDEV